MLDYVIYTIAGWVGVTDHNVLAAAEPIVLAGIILITIQFVLTFSLSLLTLMLK